MTEKGQVDATGRCPRLTVTIQGPKTADARVSANDLAEIARATQLALRRIAHALRCNTPAPRRLEPTAIDASTELFLVAWRRGSAIAEFEMGQAPADDDTLAEIADHTLRAFADGMHAIGRDEPLPGALPFGFDRSVLRACERLARVLAHGIDALRFEFVSARKSHRSFTLDHALGQRICNRVTQSADAARTVRTGRLEELNGHGALTGRLWEPDGTKWLCTFKAEQMAELSEAWMRTVQLVGQATVANGRERVIEVESFAVLDIEPSPSSAATVGSFWELHSLDELIEHQDVKLVDDLDEISDLWPLDDNADDLLQHILAERRARRRASDEGRGA